MKQPYRWKCIREQQRTIFYDSFNRYVVQNPQNLKFGKSYFKIHCIDNSYIETVILKMSGSAHWFTWWIKCNVIISEVYIICSLMVWDQRKPLSLIS